MNLIQLRLFPASPCTAHNFTLEMAAFSLQPDLAIEVNRHFLKNEYGELLFLFCCFELNDKFLYVT